MKKKAKIIGLKPHHLNGQLILHTGQKDGVIFQELHSKENNKIELILRMIFIDRFLVLPLFPLLHLFHFVSALKLRVKGSLLYWLIRIET